MIVAKKPIVKPVKKKTLTIDFLLIPKVRSIAISLVLFLTKIFFMVGFIIGSSATIFGIFLGVLFSIYIENIRFFISSIFKISLFPEEIYFLSKMPSEININSIFIISLSSIIVTILVSIYPAMQASKQDPIKSLKYE